MIPLISIIVWTGEAELGLSSVGSSESPDAIWAHRRRRSSTTDSDRDSMKPAISPWSSFSSTSSLRTTTAHCWMQVARKLPVGRAVDVLDSIGEAPADV